MAEKESLLTFPCTFPIKVMGANHKDFESNMVVIARKHVPDLGEGAVRSKPSKTGKYLAVTITIQAQSQSQLDDLYREFSAHDDVKMVL
jgi:putative lipoic acid-binding regulatory protein